MAFKKALDTKSEEYLKYMSALIRYKQCCSIFAKARKLKHSPRAEERLAYFETLEAYKAECKAYAVARAKFELYQATPLAIAMTMDTKKYPLSMKDLIEQNRAQQELANVSVTNEQFERIAKAAREYENRSIGSEAAPGDDSEVAAATNMSSLAEDLFGDETLKQKSENLKQRRMKK